MSWIFGILSRSSSSVISHHRSTIHSRALHTVSAEGLYIAVGGIPETCAGQFFANDGWAVVGLGLQLTNDRAGILSPSEWQSVLSNPNADLRRLDGHFVAVRWSPGIVECFTDQLGLRTLYVGQQEGEICFSTRLDWVARYTGKTEIDLAAFGSRWLTFNQLFGESTVLGIRKLGPGSKATLSHNSINIEDVPWLPDLKSASGSEVVSILKNFSRPFLSDGMTISLGLSGGTDSRTLLSLLEQNPRQSYSVHTFGHPDDPDVRISGDITTRLGIERCYFFEPLPPSDECIQLMREFVAHTQLVEPVSGIIRLRYYSFLRDRNKLMLDGGFGEIVRRQYLNRLLLRGKAALRKRDVNAILPLLRVHRGSFFTPEVTSMMERETKKHIDGLLDAMSDIDEFGIENFIDLLAVRTRFPNYGGLEQARLDGEVINYMPFAQPSFLNKMFSLPLSLRRNGNLCRNIIRSCPELTGFPLVKYGTTYPFQLSSLPAMVLTRAKRKLGFGFADPTIDEYLHHMKEFVLDTAHSESVKTYPAYNYKKVCDLVDGYYLQQQPVAGGVDWWLSFELWRQSLSG